MKERYSTIVIMITTLVIFILWKYVISLEIDIIPYPIVAGIALITSFGTYKLFVNIISLSARKIELVNKLFLGNTYLNGIWVGFYIGASGDIRYIVEYYEQNLENIIIRGHSYDQDSNLHASWYSSAAQINITNGKIIYSYNVTGLKNNTNGIGIAEFDLERKKITKSPVIMQGYSSDIHIGKRVRSFEVKITDKKLKKINEILLVKEAKKIERNYKKVMGF